MACIPASAQSASRLHCAVESGINRIVEMRAPPGPVSCQDRQAGARPFLLHKSHLEKNNAALPPVWGKAHEVGGGKYVDFHRIGRLTRESLPLADLETGRLATRPVHAHPSSISAVWSATRPYWPTSCPVVTRQGNNSRSFSRAPTWLPDTVSVSAGNSNSLT
jgi:hypothetical protein